MAVLPVKANVNFIKVVKFHPQNLIVMALLNFYIADRFVEDKQKITKIVKGLRNMTSPEEKPVLTKCLILERLIPCIFTRNGRQSNHGMCEHIKLSYSFNI